MFGSVAEAMEKTGADVSIIFVPPKFAKDAIIEAIDAEIPLLVVITEGIPVQDSAYAWAYNLERVPRPRDHRPELPRHHHARARRWSGITPANITGPGPVGLVSKSGTLTYQMMYELRDFGFSTSIGIGGDPVIGTTHIDAIEAFEKDPDTKLIVMIGEIGGDAEERAADYIKANVSKPVVGYVAGFTAPEGKTMGHAGAIVSGSSGTAAAKKDALEAAGVRVGKTPVGDGGVRPGDPEGRVGILSRRADAESHSAARINAIPRLLALDRGGQLPGQPFHVGGDLVFGTVRQAEQHLGHPELGPAGELLRHRLEVQRHDLRSPFAAGRSPAVLQKLHRLVDVEVARRGDPAVGAAGDPLEVLLVSGRAHQHRDVWLHRFGPGPAGPEVDELAVVGGLLLRP